MADSPITSTFFADVYKKELIVQKAMEAKGRLTLEIMEYLANPQNPVAIKIASLNAISWTEQIDNYSLFLNFLKSRYNTNSELTLLDKLDGTTLASLAYAKALSNYFEVEEAHLISFIAKSKEPNSFTINMVYALIYAQLAMDSDWCTIFQVCNWVVTNEELTQDMHPKAISQIMEYINLYKDDCNKEQK